MKTEDKVISFELAEKIWKVAKKRGVKLLDSEWWWVETSNEKIVAREAKEKWLLSDKRVYQPIVEQDWWQEFERKFPAYDVAELLEMLPAMIKTKTYGHQKKILPWTGVGIS